MFPAHEEEPSGNSLSNMDDFRLINLNFFMLLFLSAHWRAGEYLELGDNKQKQMIYLLYF